MKILRIFILNFLIMSILFGKSMEVQKKDLKVRKAVYYLNDIEYTGKARDERDIFFFKNGRAKGKWITFYKNDNIKSIVNWEDGKLNGKYILYNNDGKKSLETIYLNGKENGHYLAFYSNGNLRVKGEYDMGKPIGNWEYFDKNGKLTGRTVIKK